MTSASEQPPTVTVARAGTVTTITIERPAVRNAVDGATAQALYEAFLAFDADDDQAVAVLTGAGGTFCAGADLTAVGTDRGNRVDAVEAPDGAPANLGPMGPTRLRLGKPVIAAVEGHAVAGGLELAAWCDLRVVAQDAVLGVFCRRWGVPLIDGGTVRLPQLVGVGRALDLVLTGRPVTADEAQRIGLADRVVPSGQALTAAQALAAELAALPQTCLRHDRLALLEAWGLAEPQALAVELEHGRVSLASDALAGAARFAGGAGRHGAPG